jgi:NTE family protein
MAAAPLTRIRAIPAGPVGHAGLILPGNPAKSMRGAHASAAALPLSFKAVERLALSRRASIRPCRRPASNPTGSPAFRIGAINAAIIAGNKPGHRTAKLREFWRQVTDQPVWAYTPVGDIYHQLRNMTSATMTMTQGQPGFVAPHKVNAWLSPQAPRPRPASTIARHSEALLDLVDFSLINQCLKRFSVGDVNVLTRNFIYFDNRDEEISEHVIASGALPPAFPIVKVGTDYFWDGGIVLNTPLQHLLDQQDYVNTLVFQVDLFSSRGVLSRDMSDVLGRHKDVT